MSNRAWTHPDYPERTFTGHYMKADNDRFFYFIIDNKRKEYSSPEAAKRDGWKAK